MEITASLLHDTLTVALSGQFTFNDHPAFREVLNRIGSDEARTTLFAMDRLEFVDSAALGMLLLALDAAKSNGKSLIIRGARGQVKKMFDMANFNTLFRIE